MYNENIKIPGNQGLLREELDENLWILGAISKNGVVRDRPILTPDGHGHLAFSPSPEKQRMKNGDSNGCVSFATDNALGYASNRLAVGEEKKFLEQEGYIDSNGKVDFNDRITVIGSGTDPNEGNYVSAVARWVKKKGVWPETVFPWNNNMTVAEFYNGGRLPELPECGFKKMFDIEYEGIPSVPQNRNRHSPEQLINALKYGTPTVSVDGNYVLESNGLISSLPMQEAKQSGKDIYFWNHRITLVDYEYGVRWICHDHYNNQIISFIWDYWFGNAVLFFVKKKVPMVTLYKQKGSPAIYAKHWSENLLIPFADGEINGGDLLKTLYGVEKYSDLPRINVDVLPYPIANYSFLTK